MENNGILYIRGYIIKCDVKVQFAFGHEMLLGMNFDGREAKIVVREHFLRQLKASFMGFVL